MSSVRTPPPPPAGRPSGGSAGDRLGPWRLEARGQDGWHRARQDDEDAPSASVRVAEGARIASLEALARRWARLAEGTRTVVAPTGLLRDGARVGLVVPASEVPPIQAPLPASAAWALAHRLAAAVSAASDLGLHLELDRCDVRFDPASGEARVVRAEHLAPALGRDPRLAAVAWAEVLLAAMAAPRAPGGAGWDLEPLCAYPPQLLAALRRALGGQAPAACLGLEAATGTDVPRLVREAASRAGATDLVRVEEPGQGPYLAATELETLAAPGRPDVPALDLALDRVVVLSHAASEEGVDLSALRAQVESGGGSIPRASVLVHADLDQDAPREPLRAWPVQSPAAAVPPAPPVAAPPALRATVKADGKAELKVESAGDADAVLVVRARGGAPLLVPDDGDLVATLIGETLVDGAGACEDATAGERYAAFPRRKGALLPPGRASASDAASIEGLEAKGAIGAVSLRWTVAPWTTVIVRHASAPLDGPTAGDLLYWGREESARVHDCLDPGQRVHYAAWAVGARGGLSAPARAEAVALGPPPPIGPVKAIPGPGRVTLAWTWPDSSSYDRARILRTPPWPGGARDVLRSTPPELVDDGAPLGEALSYSLRTALDATPSVKETTVTSKAVAELVSFTATGAGRAVRLALVLPDALAHASVEVVRNLQRAPQDMQDGGFVRIGKKREYSDEPLEAGKAVHYRACLVVDGARSSGLVATATPTEQAADVTGLALAPARASLEVRFTPPGDKCDEVRLSAGPADGPLAPVAFDLAAVKGGAPVVVPAVPGQPTRVQVVTVLGGAPGTPCEAVATAWDDVEGFAARPAGGVVELSWTPPAAPPRAYRLRRAPKGKDDEVTELPVDAGASKVSDPAVIARRSYVYSLSSRWGPEAGETETEAKRAEVTVWAEPPDLERPEVRSVPGGVVVQWLPCGAKDRVNWDGVAVLTSARPLAEVRNAVEARPVGTAEELAALGLELVESRKKGKTKEQVKLPAPAAGATLVVAVASQGGPLLKVCLVEAALGLPEGFLTLRPEGGAPQPTLAWDLPPWTKGRLVGLALARGLEDAALEGLPPDELEQLAAPVRHELDPTASRFVDEQALAFVSWGYTLEATLEQDGRRQVVSGPRAVVPRSPGGKLAPKAEQGRGLFGRKQEVQVTFTLEGGKSTTPWPPFRLERGIDGQMGAKVVLKSPGGPTPPPWTDLDLGSLSKGMTLVYKVVLERARDGLGFTTGESRVTLG